MDAALRAGMAVSVGQKVPRHGVPSGVLVALRNCGMAIAREHEDSPRWSSYSPLLLHYAMSEVELAGMEFLMVYAAPPARSVRGFMCSES